MNIKWNSNNPAMFNLNKQIYYKHSLLIQKYDTIFYLIVFKITSVYLNDYIILFTSFK